MKACRPTKRTAAIERAVAAVAKLKQPFTAAEVAPAIGVDRASASCWLHRMKARGYLTSPGWGQFERTGIFPGAAAAPAEQSPPQTKTQTPTQEPPAPTPPAPAEPVDLEPDNLKPSSPGALVIGRRLGDTFEVADLAGHLGNNKQQAYYFVAQWKQRGWIDTVKQGQYRRSKSFGL
jgi:hypothetical protein